MQREQMQPIGDVLVSYSADQMPVEAIEQIHKDIASDLSLGERSYQSALRIYDLLLFIAVQKLKASS
jgi:hypothetical protein